MKPRITRVLLAVAALTSAAACRDDRHPLLATAPTAAAAAPARTSYLTVSDSSIVAGTDFYVSANVDTAAGSEQIASYVARVHFDSHQLVYIADEAITGVMRAVNATDSTVITVAGATATGLPDSRLFVLHFRARVAMRDPTLSLEISELNTVGYASRLTSVQRVQSVRVNRALR
ncbi:MAG TPA: hypothetical protein VGI97_08070 [Gemmatimonadaceae bacterium]|jgi:hypothetical protein